MFLDGGGSKIRSENPLGDNANCTQKGPRQDLKPVSFQIKVWFSTMVELCIHLHIGLICPKDLFPGVLWFSAHCMVCPLGEFAGTSTPGKISNCFKCFPLVNNLSHCKLRNPNCFKMSF